RWRGTTRVRQHCCAPRARWPNAERASKTPGCRDCAGGPGANACDDTRPTQSQPSAGCGRARCPDALAQCRSGAIAQLLHPRLLCAMIAAEHPTVGLEAVTDDPGVAVAARRGERRD